MASCDFSRSFRDPVFVLDGLAADGQSSAGRQGRDFGQTEETRRIQGTSAVCRRPVGRSSRRSRLSDSARPVGRGSVDVQLASHRFRAVRRPQEKRESY